MGPWWVCCRCLIPSSSGDTRCAITTSLTQNDGDVFLASGQQRHRAVVPDLHVGSCVPEEHPAPAVGRHQCQNVHCPESLVGTMLIVNCQVSMSQVYVLIDIIPRKGFQLLCIRQLFNHQSIVFNLVGVKVTRLVLN